MATGYWSTKAWNDIVTKYPKLESKSEGVAFCAWAIDMGIEGLAEIRERADAAGAKLKFSGASIGGAKVAMGKAKKKARGATRGAKAGAKAKGPGRPKGKKGAKKRGRPAKRGGSLTDVGAVISALLENLAGEIEDASVEYQSGRERLLVAKTSFKKLKPVFDEYHAARSKKISALLDGVR